MTEWRSWACWRRLNATAVDRVSGAATVSAAAARALQELVTTLADLAPDVYPEPLEDGLDLLLDNQPAMAPITNMANAVYLAMPAGPDEVMRVLGDVASRLADSPARIARAGKEVISNGDTVLTHSASSSVRAVFQEARRTRRFRICCTESLPEGEGVVMAADLTALGFQVEVIPDDLVIEALPGVDLVMVGADALGPEAAINKVGTLVLAREAERIGIPFYLVASREKVLPASLFDQAALGPGRDEFFELIPYALVEGVVSEDAVLDPASLGSLAVRAEVAPQLLGRSSGGPQSPP